MNIKNTISISQARKEIFSIAKQVQRPGQHYTLTENGHAKLIVLSASEFESLVETVEVLRSFPDLEEDIDGAKNEYKCDNVKLLDKILAKEGYIKVAGRKKKHGLQSRSARKSRK
jgi:prevent-host-death family protein